MTDHLQYDRNDPAGAGSGNSRNGSRAKTLLTDVGPGGIAVPRDRESGFEPQTVRSVSGGVSALARWCCRCRARGLTHGDISVH
ncbi:MULTISPECIES: transposase [unclassified Streptomyces]|uniref:transposase n=1 Tax=unclassified Streptomyces TaxID=2593676 RepID=UPI00371757A6